MSPVLSGFLMGAGSFGLIAFALAKWGERTSATRSRGVEQTSSTLSSSDAQGRQRPQPNAAPATPKPVSHPDDDATIGDLAQRGTRRADGRVWCPKSPPELCALVVGKTDIQADLVIQPYAGTWLEAKGKVSAVRDQVDVVAVGVDVGASGITIYVRLVKTKKNLAHVSALSPGDAFAGIGKLDSVSAGSLAKIVHLRDGEIV